MTAHRRKQLRNLMVLAAIAAAAIWLLPLTLPVVLGAALAAALEPWVLRLQKKTGMGRTAAAGIAVTAGLLLLALVLWALARMLLHEAAGLSGQLPGMLRAVDRWGGAVTELLSALGEKLPHGAGDALMAWGQELMSAGGTLAQKLYEGLFTLVTRILGALPDSLFFLMTMILSCYFAAGELPRLREKIELLLPQEASAWFHRVRRGLHQALGGWLRAQVKLMGVTFLTLTVGFLLLRVDSPVLLALAVSFLDALPVFGTGTILIPWALVAMMTGDMGLGVGLLGLYGAAALLRNVLEPKVLGADLGLSPLATLAAIYAGWRLLGLWGMIGFPLAAMVLMQILEKSENKPSPEGEGGPQGRMR